MVEAQVTPGEYAILKNVGNLEKRIEQVGKAERFPTYIARTDDQMENELRQKGKLGPKAKKGLADDFHKTFKFLYKVTEDGSIVEGITGPNGKPPNLMELYERMDLRGIAWNYGFGYLNALWGGWNEAKNDESLEAEKTIGKIKKLSFESPIAYLEAADSYYRKLNDFTANYEWNEKSESWILKHKDKAEPTSIIQYNDKDGNLIGTIKITGNYQGNITANYHGISREDGNIPIPLSGKQNIDFIEQTHIKMKDVNKND